ncbi:FAD-dependent monooxygenase [Sorangium cellulosum]|uniref:FAD-dependent monooxygenase n=1 Tax=Sorangium cellulosum TaxID=56 RepID=UPI003D9A873E
MLDGGEHQLVLVRPTTVQHRDPRASACGDRFHGQVREADLDQLLASLITPQWRTEEALRLRLAELGGAVEFGAALASFEQSDEGVSAVVVKGGATETVAARWLVACDGGHSIVRKQAGIAFEGETREEVRMIVADVAVDGLDRDAWRIWWHEEGALSLCPLPSTDVFQFGAAVAPRQDPELSLANMRAILERRSGRTDLRLHEPTWSSLWRANVRLVDRYREGRVFLAGDAAHIHSPAGGQGMNTGIQDAHNLGWKLAAVAKGASPALLYAFGDPHAVFEPPGCVETRTGGIDG